MSSIGKIIPVSTVLEKNCTHCNKVFTTMQGLNTHIGKMHTAQDHKKFSICSVPDPWTHTCPRSGYLFDLLIVCLHNISQLRSVDAHPYPCWLTDSVKYRTLSWSHLCLIILSALILQPAKHLCLICDKLFSTKRSYDLKRHMIKCKGKIEKPDRNENFPGPCPDLQLKTEPDRSYKVDAQL